MRRTPACLGCPGEVQRRLPVLPLEVLRPRPGHQVNEVVGGVNALQRPIQRRRIKNIPLHDLGSRLHLGSELVGVAGETAEPHALPFQQGDQPSTDVTASPSEQDDRLVGSLGGRHLGEDPLVAVRKTTGACLS